MYTQHTKATPCHPKVNIMHGSHTVQASCSPEKHRLFTPPEVTVAHVSSQWPLNSALTCLHHHRAAELFRQSQQVETFSLKNNNCDPAKLSRTSKMSNRGAKSPCSRGSVNYTANANCESSEKRWRASFSVS